MDKIYLIKDNPSGYEEIPIVIGFTLTKDEADIVVEKETKNYEKALVILANLQRLRISFTEGMAELVGEERIPIPKWANGISEKDITQAMRDERDRIKAENEEIGNRNLANFTKRRNIIFEYLKEQLAKEIIGHEGAEKYIAFNKHFGTVGINGYLYDDKPFLIEEIHRIV